MVPPFRRTTTQAIVFAYELPLSPRLIERSLLALPYAVGISSHLTIFAASRASSGAR